MFRAAGHFGVEVVGAEGANDDLAPLLQPFRVFTPSFDHVANIDKPPTIEVLGLAQPPRLQQTGVVRAVVVRHDPRRRVEPVDQQAAGVVQRVVDRTHDSRASTGLQPAGCRVQEGAGHLGIVGTFEHPEAADVGRLLLVVAAVVADQDTSHRPPPRRARNWVASPCR